MSEILDEYISAEELASQLNKSPDTVRRWVRLRLLPAPVRMGRSVYFHVPTVKEAIARKSVTAA